MGFPRCSVEVGNEDTRKQSTRDLQKNQRTTQGLTMESYSLTLDEA